MFSNSGFKINRNRFFTLWQKCQQREALLGIAQFGDVGIDEAKEQGESHLSHYINASN